VLRRLPARLGTKHGSTKRLARAVLAGCVGLLMCLVAVVALGSRIAEPISVELPRLAVDGGHGTNVVNVTIVDIRGWDTMGELSVVLAAATGVASLVFLRSRADVAQREHRRPRRLRDRLRGDEMPRSGGAAWLLAGDLVDARERSIVLEVVVRLIFHAMIVVSVYVLFAGHNAPGGGFAGGLVAGLALVARYLAGGRMELGAATPVDAGKALGLGLLLATGTAAVPLLFGADALTSTWWEADVWPFGHIEFVTSTIFDVGVYLVVIGLVLDVLRSLGAELDRQMELRGTPRRGVTT
jgi:multicomponent Na+:H+ antiporter subunit A